MASSYFHDLQTPDKIAYCWLLHRRIKSYVWNQCLISYLPTQTNKHLFVSLFTISAGDAIIHNTRPTKPVMSSLPFFLSHFVFNPSVNLLTLFTIDLFQIYPLLASRGTPWANPIPAPGDLQNRLLIFIISFLPLFKLTSAQWPMIL